MRFHNAPLNETAASQNYRQALHVHEQTFGRQHGILISLVFVLVHIGNAECHFGTCCTFELYFWLEMLDSNCCLVSKSQLMSACKMCMTCKLWLSVRHGACPISLGCD